MICPDCGQDHSELPALWPQGAKVRVIVSEISYLVPPNWEPATIPPGTIGTIAYHTEDGRPLVDFGDVYGAHSFHYPESAIELIEDRPWKFIVTDPKKIRQILDIAGVVARVNRLVLTLDNQ